MTELQRIGLTTKKLPDQITLEVTSLRDFFYHLQNLLLVKLSIPQIMSVSTGGSSR